MDKHRRLLELIALQEEGLLDESGWAELNALILNDPASLDLYRRQKALQAALHLAYSNQSMVEDMPQHAATEIPTAAPAAHPSRLGRTTLFALAACGFLLVATLWMSGLIRPQPVIAELVSGEQAAWESALPTAIGSSLPPGNMKLTQGIATFRFRSGVTMSLEAPAEVNLKSAMEVWLEYGAAILEVPEQAIGFQLKTPNGYAIDHGTAFAVHVREDGGGSDFHVIDGEISLHVSENGPELRLKDQEAASIRNDQIVEVESEVAEESNQAVEEKMLRIGSKGRSYSVIRANKAKWLHPDKLLVKRHGDKPHSRRSFFAFDLEGVDISQVQSARIRLNQVPSGIGYAIGLPEINIIGLYGLTDPSKADWQPGVTWENGPGSENGIRLGQIEIPRSEQRGSRIFEGDTLLQFLAETKTQSATFIIERETGKIKAGVPPLVHAFASDLHLEAAGPTLELLLKP